MKLKIRKDAYQNLKKLGPEVLAQIDSKLLTGDSALTVATWIQGELGQLTQLKPESLKKTLERYRRSELRNKTIERMAKAQTSDATTTIQKRFNALEEMTEMVKLQRARVDKLLLRESQLPGGLLLKDTTTEISLLKGMLMDLGRIQLETGVLVRAPKTVKGSMTMPDGSTGEFAWTVEQEELFLELEGVEYREVDDV